MSRILLLSLCYIVFHPSQSQERLLAWESDVALNYQLHHWRFNNSIGHRTLVVDEENKRSSRLAFIEVNQFVTRKLYEDIRLSVGYKYRDISLENDMRDREHRTTFQLAYTHFSEGIRLVSRVRGEQRFRKTSFAHRYRYRISADLPLNGYRLDDNEFFLVLSNEFLLENSANQNRFDNRFTLGLGYKFSKKMKSQIRYTLRSERINSSLEHISFLSTSVLFTI